MLNKRINVRGTALLPKDTRDRYRQKIARITLDAMVQFVGLLDERGTVLEINQVALDAVGIKLSDVEGRPFWTTFWWQVSKEINEELQTSIRRAAQGEFVRWDTEIYGRAGGKETIIIDASLIPVKDEQGNVVFIAAEGRDITEKKAYEREIERQRKELAKLDELKTQFFANISHEFRTPLTLMLGPIDDALGDDEVDLPAVQRERIIMVQRNALRLQKLVNALLDFSRVEAGRIQAVYEPTDLASLTHELASSFRSACERAGLVLNISTDALPEPVFVDHEMWEKIVLNLVSNAFKFTFEGQIDVSVRAVGGRAVLRVSDTGTGIPETELPRIFERFHRVEGGRGRTYEGTGIGLALVQELARLHKGEVTVESNFGRGTTFTVSLPFGSAHLPQDRIESTRSQVSTATRVEAFVSEALRWPPDGILTEAVGPPRAAPPRVAAQRARILLADDNADMREYLHRLLAASYEVTAVADGESAIAEAKRVRPDLVLTDVMMPRLDGFGLLQRLRADSHLRDLPVVILSARSGEEAKAEGMLMGADDYLVKPFSARELLARVGAHLKMAQTRQEMIDALRHRTAQFETLLDRAPIGVFMVDTSFRILEVNPVALPEFGNIPGGVIGRDLREILPIIWERKSADQILGIFQHTLQTGEAFAAPEWSGVRADRGTIEHYDWKLDRIVLADGQFGLVCYFRDISERVQADSTRQLLLGELNHRIKNTLATVQAIAQQTLRRTKDPRDFANRFYGRIQSLARVHSLMTASDWRGADLRELIRDQLLQGAVDETRLTALGPAIRLAPQKSIHLALMLHELGTNSAKYGALSAAGGWIAVSWSVKDGQLELRWVERGGPAVSAPLSRGFGTTLIEQSAKSEGGSAQMLCEAEGVTWEIMLPLPPVPGSDVLGAAEAALVHPPHSEMETGGTRPALTGWRFLVVEDEPLIGLDLADTLQRAGAQVLGPVGTESEALQLIEETQFEGALLDANLHGRPVDAIAAALTRRHIPFVFVTGYGGEGLRTSFKHAPALTKPVNDRQLVDALRRLQRKADNIVRLKSQ